MRRPYLYYLVAVCCSVGLTVVSAFASQKEPRTYTIPGSGTLRLEVPADWKGELDQPPGSSAPTITFTQKTGAPFKVLMTPIWVKYAGLGLPTHADLRRLVEGYAQPLLTRAVEKTAVLVEMKGASGAGFYFFLTDRAPKPGDYKYMSQGAILIGQLVAKFTIFTNVGQEDVVSKALSTLKTAEYKATMYRIPFPSGKRVIEFPLGNLKVNEEIPGNGWYYLTDQERGFNVSFNLDQRGRCSSSEACRDYLAADIKAPPREYCETWRKSQLGEVYLFEWMLGEIKGRDREAWLRSQMGETLFEKMQEAARKKGLDIYELMSSLRQHHMDANYFVDGVWIDVHLSKAQYEEKDRQIFTDFIESIRFRQK